MGLFRDCCREDAGFRRLPADPRRCEHRSLGPACWLRGGSVRTAVPEPVPWLLLLVGILQRGMGLACSTHGSVGSKHGCVPPDPTLVYGLLQWEGFGGFVKISLMCG